MATNLHFIRLQPGLVTVSAERIKLLLYQELGVDSSWRGKIFLTLYGAQTSDQPVTIISEKGKQSWQYRVEMPDLLERVQYVRTLTHVLLLELANRDADGRSAEIPAWLSEAVAEEFITSNELQFILPPPPTETNGISMASANVSARRANPLEHAQKKLQARPPLSFNELSWPTQNQWTGEAGEVYRSSAQLFLHQLLGLKQGRACLRAMLAELPNRYNWQFAFLSAFHSYFESALDVEKWWALQIVHFNTRDVLAQTWPFEESWRKFDQALHTPVEIHTGTNDLPLQSSVTLQTVIRGRDNPRQGQTVRQKIQELELLRSRLASEFVSLVDNYCQVLQAYSHAQDRSEKKGLRLTQETLNQLDQLDAVRAAIRPNQKALAARKL